MHSIGVGYVKDTHFSMARSEGEGHSTAYVFMGVNPFGRIFIFTITKEILG